MGEAPVGCLGDEVPQKLKQFADARHCLQILTADRNNQNLKTSAQFQYGVLSDIFGRMPLNPSIAPPLLSQPADLKMLGPRLVRLSAMKHRVYSVVKVVSKKWGGLPSPPLPFSPSFFPSP